MRARWNWLLLLPPAALLAGPFAAAFALQVFTSDSIVTIVLFQDIVAGRPLDTFVWGGHADLFPDLALLFPLYLVTRDGQLVLHAGTALLMLGTVAAATFAYREHGGRRADVFAALALLAVAGMARSLFFDMFLPNVHGGSKLLAVVCLGLLPRTRARASWLLPVLCFLAAASDALFLPGFVVPACAALLVGRRWREAATIALPALAGFLLVPTFFPLILVTGSYARPSLDAALRSLRIIGESLPPSQGGCFFAFVALDAVALALLPRRGFLGVFAATLIAASWGAVIVTGNFIEVTSSRYVGLALLFPPWLLLAWLVHRVRWTDARARLVCAGAALATAWTLTVRPAPSDSYREETALVPFLRALMAEEHIRAGLADYWYASSTTYLSGGAVPLRPIDASGEARQWVSNLDWYIGAEFRMILMEKVDRDRVRQRYGAPARTVTTPGGKELWVYAEADKIVYDPVFRSLVNHAVPGRFRAPAARLPRGTGATAGDAVVAAAGKDAPGILTYGPYLSPACGRYRVELAYAYLAPPERGKEATWDAVLWTGARPRILDAGTLEPGGVLVRELSIAPRGSLEVRTHFRGSGTVRVDSLAVTLLAPSGC